MLRLVSALSASSRASRKTLTPSLAVCPIALFTGHLARKQCHSRLPAVCSFSLLPMQRSSGDSSSGSSSVCSLCESLSDKDCLCTLDDAVAELDEENLLSLYSTLFTDSCAVAADCEDTWEQLYAALSDKTRLTLLESACADGFFNTSTEALRSPTRFTSATAARKVSQGSFVAFAVAILSAIVLGTFASHMIKRRRRQVKTAQESLLYEYTALR